MRRRSSTAIKKKRELTSASAAESDEVLYLQQLELGKGLMQNPRKEIYELRLAKEAFFSHMRLAKERVMVMISMLD